MRPEMDWQYFRHGSPGEEEASDCYHEYVPWFVEENGYLPIECRDCFKALILWSFSRSNVVRFREMLEALPIPFHGKYNESAVVFYFRQRDRMMRLLNVLQEEMARFEVEGRVQWRVSGRYWQDSYPHFFESAQTLRPIRVDGEISIRDWLIRKGIAPEPEMAGVIRRGNDPRSIRRVE